MSNRDDINSKILKAKEYLYTLNTELQREIDGKPMEIDEDNHEETIRNIVIPEFIQILKDSIQHLLEKRIEDYKKTSEGNYTRLKLQDYESLLRQYEYELRKHYKKEVISRITIEDLDTQIENFERIAKDFDDMKEKLKYEDGQFLNNDRKDNEILILRAENNNLKNVMRRCEEEKKRSANVKKKTKNDIENYKVQIERLSKQLLTIEVNAKANINININNNANIRSKWVINDDDNTNINSNSMVRNSGPSNNDAKIKKPCDSDRNEIPHSERNVLEARIKQIYNNKKRKAQESSSILDSNNATHTYNRLTNEIEEKNGKSSSKHQKNHHSSTMREKNRNDYSKSNIYHISNPLHNQTVKAQSNMNNSNNNYIKIRNLVSSNKIPESNHSHIRHQQLSNLMDKMHMVNNDGSQSANKSSLGLSSKSKGYYN